MAQWRLVRAVLLSVRPPRLVRLPQAATGRRRTSTQAGCLV